MRIKIFLILFIGVCHLSDAQLLGVRHQRKYGLPKQGEVTLNGSNEGVVVYIGDSQLAGTNDGTGSGPTPTLGTVKYWSVTNQTINNVTTNDIFDSGTLGTPAPQMGIDFYAATGTKLIFCPTASGGSSFYPLIATGTNNWSTTGTRFQIMVNNVFACLTAAGVDRPLMIKIRLGVNDARNVDAGNSDINVVYAAMDSFIDRLRALFPTTPIVFDQIGMDGGYPAGTRTKGIRRKIKSYSLLYDNVHLTGGLLAYWPSGYYHSDLLHEKQTGQNLTGTMDARWLINSSYSKYARAIIACQFDEPSTNLKDSIAYAIDNNLTEYLGLEYLYYFKTTIRNNCYLDWAMMNNPYDAAAPATFSANVGLDFDGTNDYFRTGYVASTDVRVQSATSSKTGIKIKTNDTAAGTLKFALKASNTVNLVQQAASNIYYNANDGTSTLYTTDTKIQADTEYAMGRTGTTKELSKNGTVVHSATVASPALPTTDCYIGSDGTNSFDGIIQWARSGIYSSTGNFYTALQAIADL